MDLDSEELRAQAEVFASSFSSGSGPLHFGPGALRELDQALDEWLAFTEIYAAPGQSLEPLIQPLAAFVGEVLVRAYGGRWVAAEADAAVLLPSGRLIDVFGSTRTVLAGLSPPRFATLEQL